MRNRMILLVAVVVLGGGVWLYSRGIGAGTVGVKSAVAAAVGLNDLAWTVRYEVDQLSDEKRLRTSAAHKMSDGSVISVEARCDDESTVSFNFEYHDKSGDDRSAFDITRIGDNELIMIPYRLDRGEVRIYSDKSPKYKNSTYVYFTNPSRPDSLSGWGQRILGTATEDLLQFLRADQVRFELPLGNGKNEVVTVRPKDSAFRDFLAACKIDPTKLDADAAKQAASQKAAEQNKVVEQKRAMCSAHDYVFASYFYIDSGPKIMASNNEDRIICRDGPGSVESGSARIAQEVFFHEAPDPGSDVNGIAAPGDTIEVVEPADNHFLHVKFKRNGVDVFAYIVAGAVSADAGTQASSGNP